VTSGSMAEFTAAKYYVPSVREMLGISATKDNVSFHFHVTGRRPSTKLRNLSW
jgi:hypothetical protein